MPSRTGSGPPARVGKANVEVRASADRCRGGCGAAPSPSCRLAPSGRRSGAVAGYSADVRLVQPVVGAGELALWLDPARSIAVIARIAAGRSGWAPIADGAEDRRAEDRGLEHLRDERP